MARRNQRDIVYSQVKKNKYWGDIEKLNRSYFLNGIRKLFYYKVFFLHEINVGLNLEIQILLLIFCMTLDECLYHLELNFQPKKILLIKLFPIIHAIKKYTYVSYFAFDLYKLRIYLILLFFLVLFLLSQTKYDIFDKTALLRKTPSFCINSK